MARAINLEEKLQRTQIAITFEEAIGADGHRVVGEHAQTVVHALASAQSTHHAAYWRYLSSWASQTNSRNELENAIESVWTQISRFFSESTPFQVIEFEDGYKVSSAIGLPVITQPALNKLDAALGKPRGQIEGEQFEPASTIIATGIVTYLLRLKAVIRNDVLAPFYNFQINLIAAAASISFLQLLDEQNDKLLGKIALTERTLEEHINTYFERLEKFDGDLAKIAGIDEKLKTLQLNAQDFSENLVELRSQQHATNERLRLDLEKFEAGIREEQGLAATRLLWGTRAFWAAVGFYISGGILLALLVGIPVAAYWNRGDLIDLIASIERALAVGSPRPDGVGQVADSLATIGRFLLISAPLGFVVWMIRLIVRYNMRSMLLMDDARQRLTMLDTYLFLVERDGATKGDRGAVLEALFRRPPGHGPDTAEPPNFVDLLKYGQESGGKSG